MGRERYTPQQQEFYRRYLQSPQWRKRKTARIAMAGGRCEWRYLTYDGTPVTRCARTRYLCCHHNTYDRLGAEQAGDLDVFCWFHHMLEHLLWQKCWRRTTTPCLENDVTAEKWLLIAMASLAIDLDSGSVNWRQLPTKKIFEDMLPPACPLCTQQLGG